jgi:UDP-galactopyranose mutase
MNGDLDIRQQIDSADVVVVGSGLFGLTCANLLSKFPELRILILEKRSHIGGNAYSFFDEETGIEVHKYGSHLFHTSSDRIWEYVNQFTKFNEYRHTVFTVHKNEFFSLPVNLHTISQLFHVNLSPAEARELVTNEGLMGLSESDNFESKALSSLGSRIYEAFFKGYTEKQWQLDPKKIPSSVFGRLPIRFNFNNSYFDDKYQGLPVDGYESWFKKMIESPRIEITYETDYFDWKNYIASKNKLVIYTGPLDRFFNYKHGFLGWRTLDFEVERLAIADYQGTSVINYADITVPYTRIHEFRHLHPERDYTTVSTVIMREFSRLASENDEPYYPINSPSDREKLLLYRKLQESEKSVFFGGRLGSYLYLDMHMAIASAMNLIENEVRAVL